MFFRKFTMPAALLLLLCVACQNKAAKDLKSSSLEPTAVVAESRLEAADSVGVASYAGQVGNGNDREKKEKAPGNKDDKRNLPGKPIPVSSDWDKKIVKTADLSMEVRNYRNFNENLHGILKRFGGYIAREEQSQSPYKIENTAVIKVPVAQFDEAMSLLASDSVKLITKRINAEDVTLEVVDTKSRLEAKQRARSRYLDLLKSAKNMDEILQVQNEIDGIQEQMESASGRIGYLSHEAAFSTINLAFFQVLDAGAQDDQQPSFFQKLVLSFRSGLEGAAAVLTALISIWPLWILAGLGFWAARKWRTDKTKKVVS